MRMTVLIAMLFSFSASASANRPLSFYKKQARKHLLRFCQKNHKKPLPMFDRKNLIALTSREYRIAKVTKKRATIAKYLRALKKRVKTRKKDLKHLKMGYFISDTLFSIGSYASRKALDEYGYGWLSSMLPLGKKAARMAWKIDNNDLPKPSEILLNPYKEIEKLEQMAKSKRAPKRFQSVICFLTSPNLKHGKKVCKPNHPLVVREFQYLEKSWKESKRILKKSSLSSWLAPFMEFATKHTESHLLQDKRFSHGARRLLLRHQAFLGQVQRALVNDYQAWGCQQLKKKTVM